LDGGSVSYSIIIVLRDASSAGVTTILLKIVSKKKHARKHKVSDCKATKMRCVNCMHKIKTYNLKINDEHNVLSRKCPTFIRALEEEKKRTGWESPK